MPASSYCIRGLILALSAMHAASVGASEDQGVPFNVAYAKRQATESVAQLGERIEHCNATAERRDTPVIDPSKIGSSETSRTDLIKAIGHLAVRNAFRCEMRARRQVAWDLEKLSIAANEAGIEQPDIKGISRSLIYPSAREIQSEAEYSTQPAAMRKYLEEAVGTSPFDPVETISHNDLGRPE